MQKQDRIVSQHEQGWIQDLARGGAQTGKFIGGYFEGGPDPLVSCCIFEVANNTPLSSTVYFTVVFYHFGLCRWL